MHSMTINTIRVSAKILIRNVEAVNVIMFNEKSGVVDDSRPEVT